MAFSALSNYINAHINTNGQGLIEGAEDNYVLQALLNFIIQSPINWQKVKQVTLGGVVTASRPVTVFFNAVPTSLAWPDNIYNQYIFINSTASSIPLASGYRYYDINRNQRTSIPAYTAVTIYKCENDLWIGLFNTAGTGSSVSFGAMNFEIGQPGSPLDAGETELTIPVTGAKANSDLVFMDNSFIHPGRSDRFSYTITLSDEEIVMTFNQGVQDGQVFTIKYAS